MVRLERDLVAKGLEVMAGNVKKKKSSTRCGCECRFRQSEADSRLWCKTDWQVSKDIEPVESSQGQVGVVEWGVSRWLVAIWRPCGAMMLKTAK